MSACNHYPLQIQRPHPFHPSTTRKAPTNLFGVPCFTSKRISLLFKSPPSNSHTTETEEKTETHPFLSRSGAARCWAAGYGRGELWSTSADCSVPLFRLPLVLSVPPLTLLPLLHLRCLFGSPMLMRVWVPFYYLCYYYLWLVLKQLNLFFFDKFDGFHDETLLSLTVFTCIEFPFCSSNFLVLRDIAFLLNPWWTFLRARWLTCRWHRPVKGLQNVNFSNGMSKRWVWVCSVSFSNIMLLLPSVVRAQKKKCNILCRCIKKKIQILVFFFPYWKLAMQLWMW